VTVRLSTLAEIQCAVNNKWKELLHHRRQMYNLHCCSITRCTNIYETNLLEGIIDILPYFGARTSSGPGPPHCWSF